MGNGKKETRKGEIIVLDAGIDVEETPGPLGYCCRPASFATR